MRWGDFGQSLPPTHAAWDLEARYLALGLVNWVCTLSPQRIIIGGGVMRTPGLLTRVRQHLVSLLNGYVTPGDVVTPALGDNAGVLGALALAQE
jgi:fructokinase